MHPFVDDCCDPIPAPWLLHHLHVHQPGGLPQIIMTSILELQAVQEVRGYLDRTNKEVASQLFGTDLHSAIVVQAEGQGVLATVMCIESVHSSTIVVKRPLAAVIQRHGCDARGIVPLDHLRSAEGHQGFAQPHHGVGVIRILADRACSELVHPPDALEVLRQAALVTRAGHCFRHIFQVEGLLCVAFIAVGHRGATPQFVVCSRCIGQLCVPHRLLWLGFARIEGPSILDCGSLGFRHATTMAQHLGELL
mmetsp:Transcript_22277/g.33366  ORF Transcript_22277/g.33366 Transcript_22277/m.33366 type:complete len:251 (+) Transcript_22277:422-1174(+)